MKSAYSDLWYTWILHDVTPLKRTFVAPWRKQITELHFVTCRIWKFRQLADNMLLSYLILP